jgi:hypothetical protein
MTAPWAANGTDFYDIPSRYYNGRTRWRGYLFLVTEDPVPNTMDFSPVAYWGFDEPVVPVPEPGTLVLSLITGLAFSGTWLCRKARRSNERPVTTECTPGVDFRAS